MDRTAASPITHNVADSTGQGLGHFKSYPEYKDSGVEWLGKIPAHWEITKIKYSTYVKGRIGWQGLRADEFTDEGPHCVTGTDFENGKINWDTCYRVSHQRYLLIKKLALP